MKFFTFKNGLIFTVLFFIFAVTTSFVQEMDNEILLVTIAMITLGLFIVAYLCLSLALAKFLTWSKWSIIIMPFIFPFLFFAIGGLIHRD